MSATLVKEDDSGSSNEDDFYDTEQSNNSLVNSSKCCESYEPACTEKEYGISWKLLVQESGTPWKATSDTLTIQSIACVGGMNKDEYIASLRKLLNSQKEQLDFYVRQSEDTLIALKNTCESADALQQNDDMAMAYDKFRFTHNIPTEQALVRDEITQVLVRLRSTIHHQETVIYNIDSTKKIGKPSKSKVALANKIHAYPYNIEEPNVSELYQGTKQLERTVDSLRIQLRRLCVIEEERINLIERFFSLPTDQRNHYASLMALEREKRRMQTEIERMHSYYDKLERRCNDLQADESANRYIVDMASDCELKKTGSDTPTKKSAEMVDKGELCTLKVDEDIENLKEELDEMIKQNTDLTERLMQFDRTVQERDDLKKQAKALVDSYLQLQNEVKMLRLTCKTDELLDQLKEACTERERLKVQLGQISKAGPGIIRICGEPADKIAEERDELRLKLAEYVTMEDDIKTLKFKASQMECYRVETERLKYVIAEMEEIKAAYMAFLDKSHCTVNQISPLERDMYRNMSRELDHLRVVEKQKEQMGIELARQTQIIAQEESDIKDLLIIVESLMEKVKNTNRIDFHAYSIEGMPEGPQVSNVLSAEQERIYEAIKNRVRKSACPAGQFPICRNEKKSNRVDAKKIIVDTLRTFLGFDDCQKKSIT